MEGHHKAQGRWSVLRITHSDGQGLEWLKLCRTASAPLSHQVRWRKPVKIYCSSGDSGGDSSTPLGFSGSGTSDISTLDLCVLCGEMEETLGHIFNCKYSREVLLDVSEAIGRLLWKMSSLRISSLRVGDIMEEIQKIWKNPTARGSSDIYGRKEQEMEGERAKTTVRDQQGDYQGHPPQF